MKKTVMTANGSAKFVFSNDQHDIDTGVNDRRLERAIRKASGFKGRGFSIRGNRTDGQYGKNINGVLSVYGTYSVTI